MPNLSERDKETLIHLSLLKESSAKNPRFFIHEHIVKEEDTIWIRGKYIKKENQNIFEIEKIFDSYKSYIHSLIPSFVVVAFGVYFFFGFGYYYYLF